MVKWGSVNMNYPCTENLEYFEIDKHKYRSYELKYVDNKEEFFNYIVPILKEEYGAGNNLSDKLKNISPERVKTLKKFMTKGLVPNPNDTKHENQPWLKNTRSKATECIAKDILNKIEGVFFTCRITEEEEDPDMPKRGLDNFGFIFNDENGNIVLNKIVACEVKASDSRQSPPNVVHTSEDSMFKALKSAENIDIRLKKAIAKSIDKLPEGEYIELIANIAIDIEERHELNSIKNKIMVVPFLVRKKDSYTKNDYGKFKSNYNEFEFSTISSHILVLDYDLNKFSEELFEKLREG